MTLMTKGRRTVTATMAEGAQSARPLILNP